MEEKRRLESKIASVEDELEEEQQNNEQAQERIRRAQQQVRRVEGHPWLMGWHRIEGSYMWSEYDSAILTVLLLKCWKCLHTSPKWMNTISTVVPYSNI